MIVLADSRRKIAASFVANTMEFNPDNQ